MSVIYSHVCIYIYTVDHHEKIFANRVIYSFVGCIINENIDVSADVGLLILLDAKVYIFPTVIVYDLC